MSLAVTIVVAILFAILGGAAVVSVVLGLPGAWMILALAAIIELADGLWLEGTAPRTFGWTLLIIATGLAAVGELLELLAGAAGAKKGGSSRRGAWGAIVGGVVGSIVGILIPPPVIGSLIGAVAGSFVGALLGERMHAPERGLRGGLRPATGAALGRVAGTLAKVPIAVAIWLGLTVAAFWP